MATKEIELVSKDFMFIDYENPTETLTITYETSPSYTFSYDCYAIIMMENYTTTSCTGYLLCDGVQLGVCNGVRWSSKVFFSGYFKKGKVLKQSVNHQLKIKLYKIG